MSKDGKAGKQNNTLRIPNKRQGKARVWTKKNTPQVRKSPKPQKKSSVEATHYVDIRSTYARGVGRELRGDAT